MKKEKITQEIREKLREPFPKKALKKHPTKPYLVTIKAAYVYERLNNIFGIGGWNLKHEVVFQSNDYVLVKAALTLLDYDITFTEQYGGHQISGKGVEMADGYKSAVTDALSKICGNSLEIGIDVFKGDIDPNTLDFANENRKEPPVKNAKDLNTENKNVQDLITPQQKKMIEAKIGNEMMNRNMFKELLYHSEWKVDSLSKLTKGQAKVIIDKWSIFVDKYRNIEKINKLLEIVRNLEALGISETEICAYFGIENVTEMDIVDGIASLLRIKTDIETKVISVPGFKKSAVERFEMRQKEKL
jgi:hypothetical protein